MITKVFAAIDNFSIFDEIIKNLQQKKMFSQEPKLKILIAYPSLTGQASRLLNDCKEIVDEVDLDSGTYSITTGKVKLSLEEYAQYISRFGHLFSRVFNFDDKFDDPENNDRNQRYLESKLPEGCKWRPVPVLHNFADPMGELEYYTMMGHRVIAVGSNRKKIEVFMPEARKKYPDMEFHFFGTTNREEILANEPDSVDSTAWARQAGNAVVYYWDTEKDEEVSISFSKMVKASKEDKGKMRHYTEYANNKAFRQFIGEFGYELHNLLDESASARRVLNLYFFKMLGKNLSRVKTAATGQKTN